MGDYRSSYLPERNPETQRIHRREVLRQITLPLALGIILVLVLMFFSVRGSPAAASLWADISLILLAIPAMLVSFVFFILLAGITYGIIWLIGKIPVWMRQLQDLIETIGALVRKVTDSLVEPILRIRGFQASVRSGQRNLLRTGLARRSSMPHR